MTSKVERFKGKLKGGVYGMQLLIRLKCVNCYERNIKWFGLIRPYLDFVICSIRLKGS